MSSEEFEKAEQVRKDGLSVDDIIRRAKAETSDVGLARRHIEEERYLLLRPFNKYVGRQPKSFIQTVTVTILGAIAGVILWLFLESLIWKSGLVGLAFVIVAAEVLVAFFMSKGSDSRVLEIVNGAYVDGAEYESLNHYAEAYREALKKVEQEAKATKA